MDAFGSGELKMHGQVPVIYAQRSFQWQSVQSLVAQDKYASFMQFIPFVFVVVAQNIDCGYALQRPALIWRFCRVANVSKHKQWVHIRTGYSYSMFKKKK